MPVRRCWLLVVGLLAAAPVVATEPTARSLNLRGLQIGGTTTLEVDGTDLGDAPRLVLPFPAKQILKPGSSDKKAIFEVVLGDDVPAGFHNLWIANSAGISAPFLIGVDRMAQKPIAPRIDGLPTALHGVLAGSTVVETKFEGKAGQKLLVEVEAQRLGSKLRPIVHLYGPNRLQIAWGWGSVALSGDARLETVLGADGDYTVTLHDAEYAAASPGHYRLKVGDWSYVDQVFPPAIAKGQRASVELEGSAASPRVDLGTTAASGPLLLSWPKMGPKYGLWSGQRPFVTVSDHAEVVEASDGPRPQPLPALPVGVSGRLSQPFEEDQYRIAVKPGMKLRLEVFAERIGSPIDAALVLRGEKGEVLVRAEDGPKSLDPVLDYVVPANVAGLTIGVVDAQGRGGPHGIYRLAISAPAADESDFSLSTTLARLPVPAKGRVVLPIQVERRGHRGAIALSAADLPTGVELEGRTIPEGADGTLLTVKRQAAEAGHATITRWIGKSATGEERPLFVKDHPLARLQPWLASEIPLLATADPGEFEVDWRKTPAELVVGEKLPLSVKWTTPGTPRKDAFVKLSILTSQATLAPGADPAKTLRLEKAVELPAMAGEGEAVLLVPAQLSGAVYDATIVAEALAADKKTVQATAYAPVRRLAVVRPIRVVLEGSPRIDVSLNAKTGAQVSIAGKVVRREGTQGIATVTLAGLPAALKSAPVTVPADKSEFTLTLALPPATPAGEIAGLKLSAAIAPDPKTPMVRVNSADVELTLVVQSK
jgi:hypothetical protein